eukprot:555380-Amphidinium_carterae.2
MAEYNYNYRPYCNYNFPSFLVWLVFQPPHGEEVALPATAAVPSLPQVVMKRTIRKSIHTGVESQPLQLTWVLVGQMATKLLREQPLDKLACNGRAALDVSV